MGVIAVYSPKGGVGKTTIAVDLAWRFAASGQKTLLWDLDVQGGAGFLLRAQQQAYVVDPRHLERPDKLRQKICKTGYENLSFLGTGRSLRNLSFNLIRMGPKPRISDLVRSLKGNFDRIVLDCPPVQDETSEQIIRATDLMVVPLPVSPLAARSLDFLLQDLADRKICKLPIIPVFSMYDVRRKLHRTAREGWMADFPMIPAASQIEQSAFRRAPIATFARHSEANKALERVWRGIELKLHDRHANAN
jgi:chromosome partitioning protein